MSKDAAKAVRSHVTVTQRQGEGVPIDMQVLPVTDVMGHSIALLRGNLMNLPVPDRHYSADVGYVKYARETVHILFGQERFGSDSLRNLLILKMTPAAVRTYLDTLVNEQPTSIAKQSALAGIEAEVLPEFQEEPRESVTLNANVVLAAVSGREGCMDFYYASPFSKGASVQSRKLALDPVVRIDIRTSLFLGLNSKLQDVIAGLPENLVLEGKLPKSIT